MAKNLNAGHRKRIRQKLLKHGEECFYDYELLELLLTFSIPFRDVKPIAKNLVNHFNDLKGVLDAPIDMLAEIDGIGENSIALIQLIKELGFRYLVEGSKQNKEYNPEDSLFKPKNITKVAKMKICGAKNETFLMLFLDNKGEFIAIETLKYGDADKILVSKHYVVERCYYHKIKYLAVAHNHPSGLCTPSLNDKAFTIELDRMLNELGIVLVDHVIVTPYNSYSMRINKIINNTLPIIPN